MQLHPLNDTDIVGCNVVTSDIAQNTYLSLLRRSHHYSSEAGTIASQSYVNIAKRRN